MARIESTGGTVEIEMRSGQRVRAAQALVATGAGPLGTRMLADPRRVTTTRHIATHIVVPDDFGTRLPPVMVTTSEGEEVFGGFVAPPVIYPDGRRRIKAVGQTLSMKGQRFVPHQVSGAVRAVQRLFPRLVVGTDESQLCTTTDTPTGRPIIERVGERVAIAIAGNGKGVKAAPEIGRQAASLMIAPAGAQLRPK